ncbi:MAG: hypothetical protein QMD23_05085, partial [Candidatus Bathyarchaeia archaeon]|nr:hypothetical protein [Candidatus Bathyarchaeia archaeon]
AHTRTHKLRNTSQSFDQPKPYWKGHAFKVALFSSLTFPLQLSTMRSAQKQRLMPLLCHGRSSRRLRLQHRRPKGFRSNRKTVSLPKGAG